MMEEMKNPYLEPRKTITITARPGKDVHLVTVRDVTNDRLILRINSRQVASVQPNFTLSIVPVPASGETVLVVEGEPILSLDVLMELNKQGITVHTKT